MAPSKITKPPAPESPTHDLNCLSIAELGALAHDRMDKQTRDYYNEGADDGQTLSENQTAYHKYRIRPRVLRDVSRIDTSTSVFGFRSAVPFGVAPTAMQRLAHPDGELATARACRRARVVMGLSSFATTSLEDVRAASTEKTETTEGIPNALQLYLFEEREQSARMIERAKNAGYAAVLLTVDTPMLGRRNREIRNQFSLPPHLTIANFAGPTEEVAIDPTQQTGGGGDGQSSSPQTSGPTQRKGHNGPRKRRESVAGYSDGDRRIPPSGPITFHTHAPNPTLDWETTIPWLRSVCGPTMQLWLKGIATPEDALLAVEHGVDGIVVSNHGGRQLNSSLATLDALPAIVDAVKGRIPVHVDGGVRHGSDVFKALALGADFVWVGRPVLWGLAYNGQEGVELCLRLLQDEFTLVMGLAGCTRVDQISRNYLAKVDRDGFVSKL